MRTAVLLINAGVYLAAFAVLAFRLRQAWAYAGSRWLLIALSIPIPLVTLGSWQALELNAPIGPVTFVWSLAGVFLLVVCLAWPDRRRQRALESRIRGNDGRSE